MCATCHGDGSRGQLSQGGLGAGPGLPGGFPCWASDPLIPEGRPRTRHSYRLPWRAGPRAAGPSCRPVCGVVSSVTAERSSVPTHRWLRLAELSCSDSRPPPSRQLGQLRGGHSGFRPAPHPCFPPGAPCTSKGGTWTPVASGAAQTKTSADRGSRSPGWDWTAQRHTTAGCPLAEERRLVPVHGDEKPRQSLVMDTPLGRVAPSVGVRGSGWRMPHWRRSCRRLPRRVARPPRPSVRAGGSPGAQAAPLAPQLRPDGTGSSRFWGEVCGRGATAASGLLVLGGHLPCPPAGLAGIPLTTPLMSQHPKAHPRWHSPLGVRTWGDTNAPPVATFQGLVVLMGLASRLGFTLQIKFVKG